MTDAQPNGIVVEQSSTGVTSVHIPPARPFLGSLIRALRRYGKFAGLTAGLGFGGTALGAGTMVTTSRLTSARHDATLLERIDFFWELLSSSLLPLIAVGVVLVFVGGAGLALTRDLPLYGGGIVWTDGETVEYRRQHIFGESVVFEVPRRQIEYVQTSAIQEPSIRERLEPSRDREVTLVASEGMQVVGRGFEPTESDELVEKLEQVILAP